MNMNESEGYVLLTLIVCLLICLWTYVCKQTCKKDKFSEEEQEESPSQHSDYQDPQPAHNDPIPTKKDTDEDPTSLV